MKSTSADITRKDFKEAMDSYEAFMNEYVAFMKKYNANPNDPTLMADYARYMSKYADACERLQGTTEALFIFTIKTLLTYFMKSMMICFNICGKISLKH